MICPAVSLRASHGAETAELAESQLHQLLRRLYHRQSRTDRRTDGRFPFPSLVELTPVDGASQQPSGDPFVVVGKDISEHGIGFFHPDPIPFRYAIATIDIDQGEPLRILIDLSWCRFTGRGWYENGGRFMRMIAPESRVA